VIKLIADFRDQHTIAWIFVALIALYGAGGIWLVACSEDGVTPSSEPTISINPQAGGANTQVVVSGFDFPAGTAATIRIGPPDVGATPQTYGSAIAAEDGRFIIYFLMPDRWPDGQPIIETDLMVIALNEDGGLKATAPFEFQPDPTINPNVVVTSSLEAADPILVMNEQAIVSAVLNHLTQTGVSSQVAVSVEKIEGEFARVGIFDLAPDSTGMSVGFLKSVNSTWQVLVVGQDFDSDQLLEIGIPQTILPEAILVPDG
jgi:hypothetical protein